MVDYTRALKRPFADMKTLAIGIILSIIPIVNLLAFGYFVNIAESTLKKKYDMPEFSDWGNLFIKGLMVVIGGFIYMIPAMIVFFIGIGTIAGSAAAGLMSGGNIFTILAGSGIFFLIALLFALIAGYIMPAGFIGYAKTGNFGAFFDFGTIKSKIFKGSYAITLVVMMVISVVVSIVLSIIPILGMGLSSFIVGVAFYTAMTEAYME